MSSVVAVMTGSGAGALATIALAGDSARGILESVFRSTGDKPARLETGHILLGRIIDGAESIDQVTVGCETSAFFAIHCHGNPLIVEAIVKLLERRGAEPVLPETAFAEMLCVSKHEDTIAAEARLALTTVKTLAGAKLIVNQVKTGLSQQVRQWRQQLELGSLDDTADEARQVLRDSEAARLLIEGCAVALIGPAGAGKSTLLNTLANREKAVVTGIKGTTRDWVSAEIHLPPLAVTLIDTAGFAPAEDGIDQTAQTRSLEVLERADVVLLVLDVTESAAPFDAQLSASLSARKVIPVLNKSDLPASSGIGWRPACHRPPIRISAKQGTGISELIAAIIDAAGAADLDPRMPVAFTTRQYRLMEKLAAADSRGDATGLVNELT